MFFDLHPGDRTQANQDLCNDVEKGLIRISSAALLNALTGGAIDPLISPVDARIADPAIEWRGDFPTRVTTGRSLLDAAGPGLPTPATPGILNHLDALPDLVAVPSFLDRLGQAAERGYQAALAEEERIAAAVPAMTDIRRLETLEGSAHLPALAGDPSVLDAFVEETVHQFENLFSLSAAPGEKSIKSIPEARRSKDWLGTGGWKQRTEEEELFRCIATHKALERRTAGDYAATSPARQAQGPLQKNVPDRKKVRLAVGDIKVRGKVDNTYAPTVAFDSTRLLIQLGVLRGARRTTKDVGGAYLFGTPTPPTEPGGRFLFVPVPPGFAEFGYPEKDERGRQNYFEVVGNLPGRQDAGRVWGGCYDKFLLTELKGTIGVGFKQSVVDRRIYYMVRGEEYIITGIYVDDNLFIHSDGVRFEFEKAWSERFCEPAPAPSNALDDFCGLLMEDLPGGSTALSAPHVMQSLADPVAPFVHSPAHVSTPLAGDALRRLPERPTEANPLMPEEYTEIAQRLTGIAGWICGAYRFGAYLAFVTVTQHVSTNLTKRVWNAIIRWCSYLVDSRDVRLYYHPVGQTTPFRAGSYSSCLNGPLPGSSYGGYAIGFPGSGSVQFRCLVPSKLADSSAGSETIMACQCVKAIFAMRMLTEELELKQHAPTPMSLDAKAVIDGIMMDRVSHQSRWLAAR